MQAISLRRLFLPALLALSLVQTACIVRTQPNRGRSRHSVRDSGKHRHDHCHHRGKRGKRVCHSHPHRHPHH